MKVNTALILCAGLGKRLKPLTNTIPKPMVLVGGKPLLQWHIERLVRANVKEIVINISWLGDQIEKYFGSGSDFGANILWSPRDNCVEVYDFIMSFYWRNCVSCCAAQTVKFLSQECT